MAHALQSFTEENPTTTVMSIDGIGAFDLVSRKAMLQALMSIESGSAAILFVRMFYGQASTYLWEDNEGHVHRIEQGEGGEQGSAIQGSLDDEERLLAFHDDLYVVTPDPDRLQVLYGTVQRELWAHSRIRINEGKTQVWNSGGVRPGFCDTLERIARVTDPEALVWRGSRLPTEQLGIRVLGTPLGRDDFVARHLQECLRSHQVLLDRIPEVTDVQSAWVLLLYCASARANYMLRVVRPELVEDFAVGHDLGLWTCLCRLLNVNPDNNSAKVIAGIPLSLGGLGLTRHSAFWASWADSLSMIKARHPVVAERIIGSLNNARPAGPCIRSAALAAFQLMGVEGFEVPSWEALADGLRPPSREPEDTEPGGFRHGWQHEAASRVEKHHRDRTVMPTWADHEKALMGELAELVPS